MTNSVLLQEELKRIGFVMNYDSKKLVSENTETTKNLTVENKIETLFTPKTSSEVVSEVTLKQIFKEVWEKRQSLISEQWVRGADQIGYWKVLFDQLTKGGIGVKWQVANDPVKSTFMYWGPWVIWKDTTKNGGWPVTFTTADKRLYSFKFQGGKYAGQPANNIKLESKQINAIFDLSQWGKVDGAKGGPQLANLMKTKPKSAAAAAACKTVDGKPIPANQIPAVAKQIFDELAYAFDGAGTYEGEAVAAYQKITCKPILDAVNAKVAARGMSGIKNVGDWAKDEMSDYDYEQYRKIWANLQKLGYKAPPVSQGMRAAGVVGSVTGINAIEKGAEGIQQIFGGRPMDGFEKIINAIRDFLGGVGGAVVTTILDFTGIGKVITTIGWGLLIVGDVIVWIAKGVAKIPEILLSLVSIVTTGASGAAVGKVLKPFMGKGSTIGSLIQGLAGNKILGSILKVIQAGAAKIGSMVQRAIYWLTNTSWFKKYLAGGIVGKVISSVSKTISGFIDDFSKAAAKYGGAGSTLRAGGGKELLQKKGAAKIKTAMTKDLTTDLGWEGAAIAGQELGGEKTGKLVKLTKTVKGMGTGVKDLSKTGKKVDASASTDLGTISQSNKLLSKTAAKNVGSTVKSGIKSTDTTAKVLGTDVNKQVTDAEQQRRKDAAAAEQKAIADANARAKLNSTNQNQQVNRDLGSTNVVRQPA